MTAGEPLTIPETQYEGNARIAESADGQPLRVQYGTRTVRSITSAGVPEKEVAAAFASGTGASP